MNPSSNGDAICVWQPATSGQEVNQPGSAVMWRDFPRGTEYNAWAGGRFKAVYRLPKAPRPAAAAGSGSSLDHTLKMAQAIVIGMQGATAAEKEKKEKFNEQERSKILAACGLHEGAVRYTHLKLPTNLRVEIMYLVDSFKKN